MYSTYSAITFNMLWYPVCILHALWNMHNTWQSVQHTEKHMKNLINTIHLQHSWFSPALYIISPRFLAVEIRKTLLYGTYGLFEIPVMQCRLSECQAHVWSIFADWSGGWSRGYIGYRRKWFWCEVDRVNVRWWFISDGGFDAFTERMNCSIQVLWNYTSQIAL